MGQITKPKYDSTEVPIMKGTFITRSDNELGDGPFNSIRWAYEVHLKTPYGFCDYHFAIMYGNADCPQRIDFFKKASPRFDAKPDYVWNNPAYASPESTKESVQ